MTLARTIIYGSDNDLVTVLQREVELNQLDEYGYTPLIQAAIVNSVSKAKLLLEAGAQVDFPDLTGRTALFWAADNNNYELCQLLLQHDANPNAYTIAGQSILVGPLLRKQNEIKRLLIKNGAKLSFAQDFINAKLLGHRYQLEGRADIVDATNTFTEVELEGFYLDFSIDVIINSLIDFRWNYGGKHLRKFFSKLDVIVEVLQVAAELLRYQHYLIDVEQYKKSIDQMLNYEPLLIPVSFEGHAISLIKVGSWLIRCDRGEFGRKHGTVIFYEIGKPQLFNKTFIKQLLYKRQYRHFIDDGLMQHLGLTVKWHFKVLPQKSGNCSWANIEAVVPTLMFVLLLEEGKNKNEICEREALDFYHTWQEWDKTRALTFCLQTIHDDTNEARQAAKASVLAAILFQACKYEIQVDQKKAEKILNILGRKKFHYILQSYLQVFEAEKHHYKDLLRNLHNFMEDYNVIV